MYNNNDDESENEEVVQNGSVRKNNMNKNKHLTIEETHGDRRENRRERTSESESESEVD